MLLAHVAFGIDLIALGLGIMLVIYGMRNPGDGSTLAKFFGWIITILAVISLVCTATTGYKKWQRQCMDKKMMMEQDQTMMMKPVQPMSKSTTKSTVKST